MFTSASSYICPTASLQLYIRILPSPAHTKSRSREMSLQLKPIRLYGLGRTANPLKVGIILEELGLPYEPVSVAISDVKKPEYTAINPNGRLPSIHDPNTGITLWESGAIIEYLIETYDKNRQLSFASETPEFWHARQWLHFQVSGQGPYCEYPSKPVSGCPEFWFSRYRFQSLTTTTQTDNWAGTSSSNRRRTPAP